MDDLGIFPEELIGFDSASLFLKEVFRNSQSMLFVWSHLSNRRHHILNIPPTYVANCALMAHGLAHCN